MKTLKAIIKYLFADQWSYNEDYSVRVHKETGKIEYRWEDDWGKWYDSEPMWGD